MSKIILPGLIDPHVHLRDPGQTHKENFYTGTASAIAGGFTTIIDMPNNKEPITSNKRLEEKIKIARKKIVCDVGFYFGSMGDNLEEFLKAKQKALGLKLYLNETTGNFLINKKDLEKIFTAWKRVKHSGPILLHAEDDAVETVIKIVQKTKQATHFCHISTRSDLEQIIKAKEKGLPISCGVTPHHLFLNEHDVNSLGPYGKMKPPLRGRKDVYFLWKNLNIIDLIESDHAPHTREEKNSNQPPFGVPGLETTLALLLTAVYKNKLTIGDIIRLCHKNPAKIFGIKTDPQTKIEIVPDEKWIIKNENLFTKCKWSPFAGWKVRGKVTRVFLRGKKVFEDGKILVSPGFGKVLN